MKQELSRVRVVVGVVKNKKGQLLVSKRLPHSHSGGYWEFPGGKVEPGETDFEALLRELKEEVNLDMKSATLLLQFEHEGSHRLIDLNIWEVDEYEGEAFGVEGQEIQWLFLEELHHLEMLPANARVLSELEGRN